MNETLPNGLTEQEFTRLFDGFRTGLSQWACIGEEPEKASQDLKYQLDLQEHRMKKHGLSMEIVLEPICSPISVHGLYHRNFLYDLEKAASFYQSAYYEPVYETMRYTREGKQVYHTETAPVFFQTILSPDWTDPQLESTPYTCPNCGAVTKLSLLQENGCPYCGTHFRMQDLYPRISNYYFIEIGALSPKGVKKLALKVGKILAWMCLPVFAALLHESESINLFRLLLAAFQTVSVAATIAVPAYFAFSIYTLIRFLKKSGRNIMLQTGSVRSKIKITEQLQKYDSAFDYEYFESKALALTRILMLSEEPDQCPYYRGGKLGDKFSKVVNIRYQGGFKLLSVEEKENRVEVALKLYLRSTLDYGNKVRDVNQRVTLRMHHHLKFPVNRAFSIAEVSCPHCSGSFDARKTKTCPHCGQLLDTGVDDWVVTEIAI